jgi:hypothetical protein
VDADKLGRAAERAVTRGQPTKLDQIAELHNLQQVGAHAAPGEMRQMAPNRVWRAILAAGQSLKNLPEEVAIARTLGKAGAEVPAWVQSPPALKAFKAAMASGMDATSAWLVADRVYSAEDLKKNPPEGLLGKAAKALDPEPKEKKQRYRYRPKDRSGILTGGGF